MSTAQTYLLINGQETGPFPFDHIRRGAVSGWFPADAQYRTAEDVEYRPLSDLVAAAPRCEPPSAPIRPTPWRRWFIGLGIAGAVVGILSVVVILSSSGGEALAAAVGLGGVALLGLGVVALWVLALYVSLVWIMLPWELMRRLDAILDELRRH